ncbi:MAG: UDP-N-acetylglucosamine diphosphorylase/glucosamine-1-phosphate N-acetyltransferase [Elusimicrobia bacterium RIFOXYD2_FULL_34_15]|nr:MAG: UDP-N-acetylglucosamine diphosphorylase/glucosamine-1-phosphate N-acetyltransferase [Elusimicrobia bacterium RIFOXYD2_FULL_34_15]
MKNTVALILAAGEGTRFKSETPKVLHCVLGKTIIDRVLEKVRDNFSKIIIVVGHKSELVKKSIENKKVVFVEQKKRLGSGDAVKQAENILRDFNGDVLVLSGDVPLLKKDTIKNLISFHKREKAVGTILTSEFENPFGYGRIIRDGDSVKSIIEEKDASAEERIITEINTGIYVFSSQELFKAIKKIKSNNAKKEYYLTDVISILNSENKKVCAYKIGTFDSAMHRSVSTLSEVERVGSSEEVMGINNRYELSIAEGILRKKVIKNLMLSGVTIVDPSTVYIEESVVIEKDTVIMPSTIIKGKTKIKSNCIIGPFSFIEESLIGRDVEIKASYVEGSEIADGAKIGPFAHLRKESKIASKVKIGNFTEIKKSYISENTKVSHLSYIGDSYLGKNVNIGAGTITCNYDGKLKHKTEIGDNAFIGSNTNFVAPVKIGKGALIAAGSTITEDVPDRALAIARARQVNKKR